jgi:hypothetical protein
MKKPLLLNNKYYLQAAMILPVIGILAFTGCSSIDGTVERQQATTNRVGTYLEHKQEQLQPADSDPDPGYKFMIDHTVPFL